MNFNEYQTLTATTAIYPVSNQYGMYYTTLGLAGEVGEVCNKVKKILRDDQGILSDTKRQELEDEIGDILWYVSQLSTELHCCLDTVAKNNINKLTARKERGTIQGTGDQR